MNVHKNELMLFFTLLELALIVLAGRVGGALASRLGQSAAVGEIIVGILLGPSLFGWLAPHTFNFVFHSAPPEPLLILSQLGLVLLMFQIGLEFDFAHLGERANRAAVARVSIACLSLPFTSGSRSRLSFWLERRIAGRAHQFRAVHRNGILDHGATHPGAHHDRLQSGTHPARRGGHQRGGGQRRGRLAAARVDNGADGE